MELNNLDSESMIKKYNNLYERFDILNKKYNILNENFGILKKSILESNSCYTIECNEENCKVLNK